MTESSYPSIIVAACVRHRGQLVGGDACWFSRGGSWRSDWVHKAADVAFPVFVAGAIAGRAVAVGEEVQEVAFFAGVEPAAVVVLDGVEADLAGVGFVVDFDGEDAVGDFGFGPAFGNVDGVSEPIGFCLIQSLSCRGDYG